MSTRRYASPGLCALALVLACNQSPRDQGLDGLGDGGQGDAGGAGDDGGDGGDGGDGDGGGDGGDGGDGDPDDDGPKFDVGGDGTGGAGDESDGDPCDKVDFVFMVDGSGSMADNQENLIANFPGFIDAIEEELVIEGTGEPIDYRIMVVDSDAEDMCVDGDTSNHYCSPEPQCCGGVCASSPLASCFGDPCPNPKGYEACDFVLGSGKVRDEEGNQCGFGGSERWMTAAEPDLSAAFECAARVRCGDDEELQIQAMLDSVTTQSQAAACNEGFLRDDALLVIVLLTDEEDGEKAAGINDLGSQGTPAEWKATVAGAKNGDETAVVVLALIGDQHMANPVCLPPGGVNDGMKGEPSPILQEFAESFTYGMWGSVCEPDYKPFFLEAISVIDTACDEFTPPP
jgi:hypothetical protein